MKWFFRWAMIFFAATSCLGGNQNSFEANFLPGTVVVKVKSNNFFARTNVAKLNLPSITDIKPAFPEQPSESVLSRVFRIHFSNAISPLEMAKKLQRTGIFAYAEPLWISKIQGIIPNDRLFAEQFYLRQINASLAWTINTGSENVVIAIVDNGTDYEHPDLIDNLWTNEAELNGLAGVDDDGNGFIDDIHGWDFGENDPDPHNSPDKSRIAGHGTHTAGLAAAVSNNKIGIASAGFSCQIMPIKASTDDEPLEIPFGYEGIVYAADNGADIINCSWGHAGNFSQFEQDVIDYAVSKGCMVIAAAGNNRSERLFYPASYAHVFSVAALDENDHKASYSSYGIFVDASAPGGDEPIGKPGLLSLYPVENGSYGEMSGTSMASPLAAGMMGLLRTQYPTWDVLKLYRQLALTADNINEKNPDYAGKLGIGRINGYRALTESNLTESPAKIMFLTASVSDSVSGDGDFLLERNEIITVSATYQNFSLSAGSDFQIQLTTQDQDLEIIDGFEQITNFPPDSIWEFENILSFRIRNNAQTHLAAISLNFTVENGNSGSDTVFVPIGKSSILLVDDDGGREIDRYYTFLLENLKVPFLRWDRDRLGAPSSELMKHFPMTIWFCEWAFPSLDAMDRIAIKDYLDAGGNLFISGQDIGWDLADPNGEHAQFSQETKDFYENYLHSRYQNDNSLASNVVGMAGTLGQGLDFRIYQPGIPIHFQFPDWIEPAPGAVSCFRYANQKGAGVFFAGEHRVLNLGFGFEAIDSFKDDTPTRISKKRLQFLNRVFRFMGPLRHDPIPDMENIEHAIAHFKVTVAPLVSLTDSLFLFLKSDSTQTFERHFLSVDSKGNAELKMHFEYFPGNYQYYFELHDPYFTYRLPAGAPSSTFSFTIGSDKEKPQIFHNPLADIIVQNKPRSVLVSVTDNSAVDTHSVRLHFETNNLSDSLTMMPIAENLFSAEIPAVDVIADSVVYFFTARDTAEIPNRAKSKYYTYFIGRDDFELGLKNWQTDSSVWRLDDREARSGMFSISTLPGGSYSKNIDASIDLIPGICVKALKDINFTFWTKYQIEFPDDFGLVEVKKNKSGEWQIVSEMISGTEESWKKLTIPLTQFYAETDDSIFIRFHFQSDSNQTEPMAGWFIDDVAFEKKSVSGLSQNENNQNRAEFFEIIACYPNPFNSRVKISYYLAKKSAIDFSIFNVRGQLVYQRQIAAQNTGFHDAIWEGTNSQQRRCTSGIYFLRFLIKPSFGDGTKIIKTTKIIFLQ